MAKGQAKDSSSSKIQKLENENQTLKNKVDLQSDPNAKPRTITKGNRVYPKYQKNDKKIVAILPKTK